VSAIHPEQTFAESAVRHGDQSPAFGALLVSAPDPSWSIGRFVIGDDIHAHSSAGINHLRST
jgi:hypothetical protein